MNTLKEYKLLFYYKIITLLLLIFFLPGCSKCNLIACNGGFKLRASYNDNGSLTKGEYIVHLAVEEYKFDVKCEVTDLSKRAACDFIEDIPEGWLIVVMLDSEDTGDIKKSFTEINISIADTSDSHGDFSATTGPDFVQVSIETGGKIIGEGKYHPEYDRDYDYYGDKQCGYCDSLVEEHLVLKDN